MRTTLELPSDLLLEAMKVSHVKTKTMAIVLGLQELIHKHRLGQLRGLRGRLDLAVDLKESRRR